MNTVLISQETSEYEGKKKSKVLANISWQGSRMNLKKKKQKD